jgi:hypothetical protein
MLQTDVVRSEAELLQISADEPLMAFVLNQDDDL